MAHYPYLIIGGGMAAAAAVRGIREVDREGPIGLIGAEPDPPYARPPLSKGLWTGEAVDGIWSRLESTGAELYLGRAATGLDARNKRVIDAAGSIYTFDKLLLATGGTPRRFPTADERIVYLRTLDDYRRLHALAAQRRCFAVIGGRFIAAEMAAALRLNGKDVVMLVPGDAIGGHLLPHDLAQALTAFYREKGVEVRTEDRVVGLEARRDHVVVRTRRDQEIVVDGVVAGIGLRPNIALAHEAALAVDRGIPVDEYLRTSHPDIYAAGDVAEFPDYVLGARRRVEHEDNATTMGRLAGRGMAGAEAPYRHLPFFYSDLFERGHEAVGELDGRFDTVADWAKPYHTGVVYYLRGTHVRGVLLWNVWGQVEAARHLIAEPGPFRPADLIGRLPRSD